MLKFKITGERFAEAVNLVEFLNLTSNKGNKEITYRVIPRFLLDENGEYMVTIKMDEDGDIQEFVNLNKAMLTMTAVNSNRLEKLALELMEAAKAIVNPPNTEG